jgi:hypothetical protein
LEDYDALFEEKLELLLTIREHEHVHWTGKYRAPLTGQGVYPRPMQESLPIWLGVGGTPKSFARAGALGLPFPDKVLAPEWDRWIRDTAKSAGAPPDYVAMPLLSALAALVGNARVVSPWEGWKEPSILWTGIVGDPSSGKSPGSDPVLSLVRGIERERAESFDETYRQWQTLVASAEIIKETWNGKVREAIKSGAEPPTMPAGACAPPEPERPRIITSDVTPERLGAMLGANPKGLFSVRDELSGWIQGFDRYSKSGERSFWIEAYGGRAFTIDRVKAGSFAALRRSWSALSMAGSRVASWVPSWPSDLKPYCFRSNPPASVNSNSASLMLVAPKSTAKKDFLFSIISDP